MPGTWLQPPVYQSSLTLSLSPPLFPMQPRLDAVASQPPITRLAHVLTAAFGCDLVAGQSDGSNDDGLASGQHQHPTPALLYPLSLSSPVCPVNVLCGTQHKIVGHFMQLLPCHTDTARGNPHYPASFQLPTPIPTPLTQFARSTNFHKIFPPRGKALAQLRALLARILQFLSFFVSRERQTPLSELAPSTVPCFAPSPSLSLPLSLCSFCCLAL